MQMFHFIPYFIQHLIQLPSPFTMCHIYICNSFIYLTVRINNYYGATRGVIQIFYDGEWGSICDDGYVGAFTIYSLAFHDDVIKWKHIPRYWPFARTKASDAKLRCFFCLRPNKLLSKQSRGWWFETLSRPLWRHRNGDFNFVWHPTTLGHNILVTAIEFMSFMYEQVRGI